MPSDDSWDFKIEKPKNKKEKSEKKPSSRPRSTKAAVAQEKRKRRQEASELADQGSKVKVETSIKKRKSRSELAKEYEREEDKKKEPHPHEIYGSLIRRSIAIALDGALIVFAVMSALTFKANMWIELESKIFGLNDFGQGPLLTYFGSLALLLYLVISVLPSIMFGRTFGKTLAGVKIYGEGFDSLGFLKTFLREIFLKPVTAISVLGAFICYFSKKRKMLHDHLIGSVVRRF